MKRWLFVGGSIAVLTASFFVARQQIHSLKSTSSVAQSTTSTEAEVAPTSTSQTEVQPTPAPSVSFMIGGDMMFGRMIAHTFGHTTLTKAVESLGDQLFQGHDARIVNLEGPVSETDVPDNIRTDNMTFNFPPSAIDALTYLHVNVASQANNHTGNAGAAGLKTTRKLLVNANIQPVSGPAADDVSRVAIVHGNTLSLVIIGVETLSGTPDITPLIAQYHADPNNRVLIFPHWGNEYATTHGASQTVSAHTWIDAGADIVIGSHPHVVQDSELYQGKPIFYSLGNLLFDQTFSAETQQGMIISGTFTGSTLTLVGTPVESKQLKPSVVTGDTKQDRLQRIYAAFDAEKQSTPTGDTLVFQY